VVTNSGGRQVWVQPEVHEREKFASLSSARATCDSLAEGVISLFYN
jgi:hypothetical protein